MPLNNIQVKSAKARERQYKLSDGMGMYLLVHPSGGKYWRLKYRFKGKEKVLSLGVYPEASLSKAREKRDVAKRLLADGDDPSVAKKLLKFKQGEVESFEAVAREWHDKQKTVLADSTARDTLSKLNNHVFRHVGNLTITDISAPQWLAVLRRVESAGKIHSAHTIKGIVSRVYRYAIATGRATHDPAADLRGALTPEVTKHHAAITKPKEIGKLMRDIDTYTDIGSYPVACALQLAPMFFVRPGELRRAQWQDVDLENRLWTIPKETMKVVGGERREHLVPLSTQAIVILTALSSVTGKGDYVFSTRNKPMSENTINKALTKLGYSGDEVVGHGFRTTASTILHEQGYLSDAIERQLAHVESNDVKRAYNKAKHLEERTKMMQGWSDYLFGLKADKVGSVISLRRVKD